MACCRAHLLDVTLSESRALIDCRNRRGRVLGSSYGSSLVPTKADVDIQGEQCCFEIWRGGAVKRVETIGDCPVQDCGKNWLAPL